MNDTISRQEAIDALWKALYEYEDKTEKQFQESEDLDVSDWIMCYRTWVQNMSDIDRQTILELPSARSERLTDDDFEVIRIHLSAIKERLCNQNRWKEAEEYERIIDRFVAFVSDATERKKGKWKVKIRDGRAFFICSECNDEVDICGYGFCPNCGADNRGEQE